MLVEFGDFDRISEGGGDFVDERERRDWCL